jgi:hypothetical protein
MAYPKKKIISPGEKNASGGSISYVQYAPDFDKFSPEDWAIYNKEHAEKVANQGQIFFMIISFIAGWFAHIMFSSY